MSVLSARPAVSLYVQSPAIASSFPSKIRPTISSERLRIALPELPPVMSFVLTKSTGSAAYFCPNAALPIDWRHVCSWRGRAKSPVFPRAIASVNIPPHQVAREGHRRVRGGLELAGRGVNPLFPGVDGSDLRAADHRVGHGSGSRRRSHVPGQLLDRRNPLGRQQCERSFESRGQHLLVE